MKHLIYSFAALLVFQLTIAQTDTKNYIKTTTYQVKTQNGSTNASTGHALTDDDKIERITYFDGLGRPVQSIAKQAGGHKEHILTPVVYDIYGRQTKDYLPYAYSASQSIALNYLTPLDVLEDLESYYVNKYPDDQITSSTINAYSEKVLEASPLNRVLEQGAPGRDWLAHPLSDSDHTIKFSYQTNIANEVRLFKVSHPGSNTEQTALEYGGFYSANELYKTITKDENWQPGQTYIKNHTTEEFKDKQGRVLLKRAYDNNIAHDTYYIYDDFGNLTYVLSPEGSASILNGSNHVQQTVLDKLCYQYHYDHRNRLIEKKIPGKGWEYIVYNKLDQPILTQDANLDTQNLWLFTKYDAFGRVAYTGTMSSSSSRGALQTSVNGLTHKNEARTSSTTSIAGTAVYYDNQAYPTTNIQQLLTINYYDNYNWNTGNSFEAKYISSSDSYSGLSFVDNTISKTSTSESWNAGFKSQATITGDGYIQWTVTQTDKLVMVGLSRTNSAPDNQYNTIDYAIYTGSGTENRVFIYEEGVSKSFPVTYCAVGDVFKVERVGDQILYKKNDIVFYISSTPSTGALLGDSSFFSSGTIIEDVFIGYSVMGQAFSGNTKGLATGSMVRVLDTNDWIKNVSYYDVKGRPIHNTSVNSYINTSDATSSLLDFTGKVLKVHTTHKFGYGGKKAAPIVTVDRFVYDHVGRLLRQTQSINSGAEQLISKNNYDELGQLTQKQVGGTLPQWSTYVNHAPNVSTANNIITKVSGTNVWNDAGVATQESIQGDGYLSFKVTQVWNSFMAGLAYNDVGAHYNTINYAIYILAGGKVHVYESGVNKGEKTSYVPGDTFSVERRGNSVYYLKNGEPFYASTVPTTTASMVGDVCIYHVNTVIKDLVLVNLENTLQDVDYAYNIRGWLKNINNPSDLGSDLFGFQIGYNSPTVSGATPLYNGNISETLWKTDNIDNSLKSYKYTYDALNRITTGIDNTNNYSLGSISPVTYDKNGNIKSIHRKGHTNEAATTFGVMDDLSYVYDGNQLKKVTDSGNTTYGFNDGINITNEYVYDFNGNMIEDHNKGINRIQYNHLNLPIEVSFITGGVIEYVYDATGVKQKKIVKSLSNHISTLYVGNYIYESNTVTVPGFPPTQSVVTELKFFSHPEGYVEPDGQGNFDYIYQYKDHLGNIRLSYKDSNGDYQVLLEDTFSEGIGDWIAAISITNDVGRLKVIANGAYNGASVFLGDGFSSGDVVSVRIAIDTGNTDMVRRYVYETNASGTVLGYYEVDYDAQTGAHVFEHTIVAGTKLFIKIDKSNYSADVGTLTHFFVDDVFVHKGSLDILEENNYYPFGLKHRGYNNVINGTDHPYGYNGKEEQDGFGLQWLDFDTRNYDAALGRWMNIDPLAEEMRRFSPYTFAFNNPIYYIDPDGMMPIGLGQMDEEKNFDFSDFDDPQHITSTVVNDKGVIIDHKDDGDPNIYLNERTEENIIGTEQTNNDYKVGGYLEIDDINPGVSLKDGFTLMIERDAIKPTALEVPWYLGGKGGWKVRNVVGFYARLKVLFSGGTYKVAIQSLGGLEEGASMIKLLKAFEAEAKASGASSIIIEGVEIYNKKFLEKIKLVERLGYKIENVTETTLKIIKKL